MKNKLLLLSFYTLLLTSLILLAVTTIKASNLLNPDIWNTDTADLFALAQKSLGVINIISFIVLLGVSLSLYYQTNKHNYLFITNLLFVIFTLQNYVSLTKKQLILTGQEPSESGEFYLMIFVGVFYIAGAVLVTAIGYITIKNLLLRNKNLGEKLNKRKSKKI